MDSWICDGLRGQGGLAHPPRSAAHPRDVARRRRARAEAREGKSGIEWAHDAVHLCTALDCALTLSTRCDEATHARAGGRGLAVVQDIVAVALAVNRPPVAVVRLPQQTVRRHHIGHRVVQRLHLHVHPQNSPVRRALGHRCPGPPRRGAHGEGSPHRTLGRRKVKAHVINCGGPPLDRAVEVGLARIEARGKQPAARRAHRPERATYP
mmetsp:Transcript_2256/g.5998  ORF Transcript_2256/g.5998 Transcript_2256/m.5998 type:complete len:209 (+) Transcript_2256:285-911(+)